MKTNNKISVRQDLLTPLIEGDSTTRSMSSKEKENLVREWYFARSFVEQRLNNILYRKDNGGAPKFVIDGVSSQMCTIIREIILRAHYTDFVEPKNDKTKLNQTVIVVLCDKGQKEATQKTLRNTPFLGNYIDYSWGTFDMEALDYLDVDVIVKEKPYGEKPNVSEEMFEGIVYSSDIDICRAQMANNIYCIGNDIYNLPDIRPEDIDMYEIPLREFESKSFIKDIDKEWDKLSVKNKLSNVFCTDIFPQRLAILESSKNSEDTIKQTIEKNIRNLSQSEHSRWVAEKLILGFIPWTATHHYEYSLLFDDDKQKYYKMLKSKEIHLDICSYRDLCRLDPQNRKYDTFLILSCLK